MEIIFLKNKIKYFINFFFFYENIYLKKFLIIIFFLKFIQFFSKYYFNKKIFVHFFFLKNIKILVELFLKFSFIIRFICYTLFHFKVKMKNKIDKYLC